MARITIEDCIEKVPNRFQLVQMAAIRAKQLKKGARPLLVSEGNKDVVMSLREIAAGLVKPGGADAGPENIESPSPVQEPAGSESETAVQAPIADGSSSGL